MADANPAKTYCIKVKEDCMEIEEAPETASGECVIIGDLWGYISDVNSAVVKIFGAKDKSEFIGRHIVEFVAKVDKSRALQTSLDAVANNKVRKEVYRVLTKDGKEVTVEVTMDFIRNSKGESIGFIDIIKPLPDP